MVFVWRFAQIHVETARKAVAGLLLTAALLLPLSLPAQADNAQYLYDPGGRLIGMIDPVNGSAQYSYDQAGNILSIARTPNNTLGVVQFFPTRGPVGTSVTISGTAFVGGTTTVKFFNNITATPTAVTANSITVPVPSGATTGPITISTTTPAASLTTAASFTVAPAPAAPTITSFTPTTQVQDSTVTIAGTNFDTANSKAYVNGQSAQITATTATSLTIKVPPASSGRVTVQTPTGSVTSTSDLIVPPPGYTAATVIATARTTLGASPTAMNVTPNKAALLLFDVTAGQTFTAYSAAPNSGCETIWILGPAGQPLSPPMVCHGSNWFGPFPIKQTGTYSVVMTSSTYTGAITTSLYNVPPPITGTIPLDGSTTPISFGTPGQYAVLTFNNTVPNQKVTIHFNFTGMGSANTRSILNPDQSTYLVPVTDDNAGQFWQNNAVITLAQTGIYTVKLQPDLAPTGGGGSGVGTTQLNIFSVPGDATATLVIGGGAQPLPITVPGQAGKYTFSGTAGQKISLNLNFGSMTTCGTFSLRRSNGTPVIADTYTCTNSFITTLPVNDSAYYVPIVFDLGGAVTGGTGTMSGSVAISP